MKTITILSGKGGVGKSSITSSLAVTLAKKHNIICADCDVDASNLALVLGVKELEEKKPITTNQKAKIDPKKCTNCGKCIETCYFNAISKKPEIDQFACEGCSVCTLVCPVGAITLHDVQNADIGYADTDYGFKVVTGQLKMGESGSGKVVAQVRRLAEKHADKAEFMLIDAAAGIGCPVIASVTGADYCVIVTEPSPSGFSDMKRAYEVVEHFNIRSGIVINKFDLNDDFVKKIKGFAEKNNVKIIAEIPYDKSFVEALVQLTPIVKHNKKYERIFEKISEAIR